jgi:hypothetical protein
MREKPRSGHGCGHTDRETNWVQAKLQDRQRKDQQYRQAARAQHVETVSKRAHLTDAELIAQAPGFPGPGYGMEMNRRLKAAITDLTCELLPSASPRTGPPGGYSG